ncbi:hypothetical protein ACMD2_02513 [Ananas comosus]|uniref:Uncharacterized protein n=1 Tax=Ananas comosus TaxID=4615 RepID=A0A199V942_ANACO|nr:hypothetical protein ACMD2_02513 [Ananas comosus]
MLVLSSPPPSTPPPTPPRPANSPVSARFSPGLRRGSAVPPPQRRSAPLLSLSCPPPVSAQNDLGSRRSDSEIGLVSLLFVLSVVIIISLFSPIYDDALVSGFAHTQRCYFGFEAVESIGHNVQQQASKRLAVSADKLSEVVSEDVPGTLLSLKLSSLEINDLTSQLNDLRQRIAGRHSGKKGRKNKPRSNGGNNPILPCYLTEQPEMLTEVLCSKRLRDLFSESAPPIPFQIKCRVRRESQINTKKKQENKLGSNYSDHFIGTQEIDKRTFQLTMMP